MNGFSVICASGLTVGISCSYRWLMDVSSINALGYLAAEDGAIRDGDGIAALRRLRKQINSLPHVRVRLALEFLRMAATAVEQREDPERLAFLGLLFTAQESTNAAPGIIEGIENLALLIFEGMSGEPNEGFGHTVASCLERLQQIDPARFRATLRRLKQRLAGPADPRHAVLATAEESTEQKMGRIRDLHRSAESLWFERQRSLRSASN